MLRRGAADGRRYRPAKAEATRRQLEGAWELVKLETYPAPGKVVPIEATGPDDVRCVRKRADPGELCREAVPMPSGSSPMRGRWSSTPQKKEGRLVEVTPEGKRDVTNLPTEVGIDKIRMYEFVNDQFKLSLRDAAGNVIATATWRRAS